jgi:hypothetical protein
MNLKEYIEMKEMQDDFDIATLNLVEHNEGERFFEIIEQYATYKAKCAHKDARHEAASIVAGSVGDLDQIHGKIMNIQYR